MGVPQVAAAGFAGDWKATSNSVVELVIGVSGGVAEVHAFGACSPTACDLGDVRGIALAPQAFARPTPSY